MIEDVWELTPSELLVAERGRRAVDAFPVTAPLVVFDSDGRLRQPSQIEQITEDIFANYSKEVRRFSDDGSTIVEQLPADLTHGSYINRVFLAGDTHVRVLSHIRFAGAFALNTIRLPNQSVFSESDGQLVVGHGNYVRSIDVNERKTLIKSLNAMQKYRQR